MEALVAMVMICRVNVHTVLDPCTQEAVGIGLYPSGAMLNHSCVPNCDYLPAHDGRMRFVTIREVAEGEELTVQYGDNLTSPTKERRADLAADYFFRCLCARCEAPPEMQAVFDDRLVTQTLVAAAADGAELTARSRLPVTIWVTMP